jgi:hypothetical protein
MKRLALQALVPVGAILLVSVLLGWLLSSSGSTAAGLRDVAVILMAIFSLVGSLIAAAIYFAGAWAIGRFGQKAVTAVNWVRRKVVLVETKAQSITERAAVRPVARTARLLTAGRTFAEAALRVDAD